MTSFESQQMPSFAGATGWLNSGPLDLAELGGRVVLVGSAARDADHAGVQALDRRS